MSVEAGIPTNSSGGVMPREMAGQVDLVNQINFSQVECFNQKQDLNIKNALQAEIRGDSELLLESDADEQLLIHIPFHSGLAVGGILIQGPPDSGAKKVKVFKNEATLGFQEAESRKAVFEIELTKEQLENKTFIPLQRVQFSRVSVVTIFIESNQEDTESTKVTWISLSGWPGETMDVGSIKKQGEEE
eukprot:TRINITY_DN1850_c0_g4_i1.p1 TRINITY_DN1850_c0_g4~~TRINITY_DN1850_c0_g4_i1.p1  ORF type:complete len:189 (-),score=39.73 TRINITY_DN1850_c0_g4_i1:130-696(-)